MEVMALDTDYCVYVVDLNPIVWEKRQMRKANPNFDPATGRGYLYVGMTQYSPDDRLKTHREGGFTSALVVREHGRYLRRRLYERIPRMSKANAEAMERKHAEDLRRRGYAVWPVAGGGMLGALGRSL